jgi:hypothetical protein
MIPNKFDEFWVAVMQPAPANIASATVGHGVGCGESFRITVDFLMPCKPKPGDSAAGRGRGPCEA